MESVKASRQSVGGESHDTLDRGGTKDTGTRVRRRIVAVLVLASAGWACSRPPSKPPAQRSVILVTIDTLRADHVTPQIAPVLDRLARESVTFDRAVTVAPLTLPAHASLLTAMYPQAHGVRDNQIFSLGEGTPTYASWLKARGYATAAFVSAIVLDHRYGLAAGFDTYDDEMSGAAERSAHATLERAEQWLGTTRTPLFLWVHLFEPHAPYGTGSYASEITTVDRELGDFFADLQHRGLWDDAVVSVTSDHGESLGEHGESTHGLFVYDSTIRVPWILKAPGQAPRRFTHQVRILDVLPTMIELANAGGADVSRPGNVDGVNLGPFLARDDSPRLEAYSESLLPLHQFNWSELKAVRTDRFKYIDAPEPELYDLTRDPSEASNVLSGNGAVAASMKSTLAAIERSRHAPTGRTQRPEGDPVMAERFMALGYIGYSPAPPAPDKRLPDPKRKLQVYELTMSAYELAGRNKPAEALAALRRAEQIDPDVTQVLYLKGTILGNQERFAEAAAALERAVALNPKFVPARFKLALAYLRLGQHDEAERGLRQVLDQEPRNVRAHHNLAAIAYSRGDLGRAEELERQALAIDTTYFEAWNTLGAIYVVSKRPTEAIQALNTAIRLNPSSGQAQYNLALALGAAGEAERASEAAKRACSLDTRFCGKG
jgi:choline-sulfatase